MFLRRLDLHGFKSFADKTSLTFDAGVTCIVGPNGSGKSNVVDAVRWVIGEQRARVLRSDTMGSVLFNGSKSRKPLGLADVRLTVENTRGVLPSAYTEVTVGRRLYRSGESEYLLNGVDCRLRDIQDLFLDTGLGAGAYSIIELSMVEELLSEADEDRRRLFEEAAGVTRYKLRRRQATARLDATRHDLARVRDVETELASRVATLKRQAERAARHRDLAARLTALDDRIAYADLATLDRQSADLDARLEGLVADLATLDARVSTGEATAATLALARQSAETARLDARAALDAHLRRVHDLDAERRLADERRARADADLARVRAEHDEAARRRAAVQSAHRRFDVEAGSAAPAAANAADALAAATAARDDAQRVVDDARVRLGEARTAERAAAGAREAAERERDRLATRRDLVARDRDRLAATSDAPTTAAVDTAALDVERTAATAASEAARAALDAADALRVGLDAEAAALADERRAADAHAAALDAEARVLRRLVTQQTDRAGALRALATAPGLDHHAGVLVTVADVLRPDGAHAATALRAVLGPALDDVVAATDAEADALLAHLRGANAGQATVHVLERIAPVATSDDLPGTPLAARVAPVADRYAALRDALLAAVVLVDDADAARRVAADHAGTVAVAPDGTWAAGARVHGGSDTPGEAAPSRLEQAERLQRLDADLAAARDAVAALDARRLALAAERPRADPAPHRRALDEVQRTLARLDTALARAGAEAAAAERQRAERAQRLAALDADLAEIDARRPALDAAATAAAEAEQAARTQREAAESAVAAAERETAGAFAAFTAAALADAEARQRLDQLRRDADRTAASLADLDRQQDARTRSLAALEDAVRDARQRLRTATEALDAAAPDRHALDTAVQSAEAALLDADAAAQAHEATLRDDRRRREEALLARQDAHARRQSLDAQRTALLARLDDERGAPFDPDTLDDPPDLDTFDVDAARRERADVRRRLDGLGAVNALALDEYETESARLETLSAQLRDLEAAEATLAQTIADLNAEASRRFRETFAEIQTSFARLFGDLFGEGASASVSLADERAPLESSIDIVARPAGKRPAAITQLSGGEKTLTAIALLFAIYLVKPSPFCLLDEVDAPLDEANVDRFMTLLRRFSGDTQFLVITHNKRTMELADRLYGVTMQEPGVSTVVSVRFNQAADLVA